MQQNHEFNKLYIQSYIPYVLLDYHKIILNYSLHWYSILDAKISSL